MPRDATMSWLVQHHKANPTHLVRETIELPPHCVTCGDKSPMYDLRADVKLPYVFTPRNCPRGEHLAGMSYEAERDLFKCSLCGFEASAEMGAI